MPTDAPELKVKATKSYGGNIVFYDRHLEDRVAIGLKLSEEQGMTLIHPYDNRDVISGQGTAAFELISEIGHLDYLFVCVGGGGLISGSALSAKAHNPLCKVYGVEPEAGNDAQMSLRTGSIVKIPTPVTIADGAQTQYIGNLTFEIMKSTVEDIITVSDEELKSCMHFFAERMKIVVEPTGCLGLAGLLKMAKNPESGLVLDINKKIGVILSGGNVDMIRFSSMISTCIPLL
jgi:threonine dehydratase